MRQKFVINTLLALIPLILGFALVACGGQANKQQRSSLTEDSEIPELETASLIFTSRLSCRAITTNEFGLCDNNDCKAIVLGTRSRCDTTDCEAMVLGLPANCSTDDCKAVAMRAQGLCRSQKCRAIVTRNQALCF